MLNTMINTDMLILSAYINYSALCETIKNAFHDEFNFPEFDTYTDLNDNNTYVLVRKERNNFDEPACYYVEITYFDGMNIPPDTVGKYVELDEASAAETDKILIEFTKYALAHIDD